MKSRTLIMLMAISLVAIPMSFAGEKSTPQQRAEIDQIATQCKADAETADTCLEALRPALYPLTVTRHCAPPSDEELEKIFTHIDEEVRQVNFYISIDCVEGEKVEVILPSYENWDQVHNRANYFGKTYQVSNADWTVLLPLLEKYPALARENMIVFPGTYYDATFCGLPQRLVLFIREFQGLSLGYHFADNFPTSDYRFALVVKR